MGFISRFRIRQMMREARTGCTVLFGMFISLLIMMMGINCYVMCRNVSVENREDTRYEYMYTYKYPEETPPADGEISFAKTLKKEIYGNNLDITLLGTAKNNPYFDTRAAEGENGVVVASATAQKYHLSVGDSLILTDEEEDTDYVFRVRKIIPYSPGMYVFMELGSMRELFGKSEAYYNVVFSGKKLDIDPGRQYAETTREEICKSADVFSSMMMPLISMLCAASAFIFCMVLFLMMKVMVDRAAFGISLVKVFGYREKEIRRLYLDGHFYMIAVGAAVCIPLAKMLMDAIYPVLVSNLACSMNLTLGWQLYLGIYGAVIGLYFVINQLLVRKLKRVMPADVLKNRE